MSRIPRFAQRSLHSLWRRAGVVVRRHGLNRFVRSKKVRLIELNGRRYKRVTLPDSFVAASVAANVAVFRRFDIFPRVVAVQDRDLLLEFVEGSQLHGAIDDARIDLFAGFFSTLYGVDRAPIALADSGFDEELRLDLDFLRDVGILGAAAWRDLATAVDRVAPKQVWVGYDYLDPLFKNFLVTADRRLVAIDVEEIFPDQLIGSGVAKLLLRELGAHRERLLDRLASGPSIDLKPVMPFVELHFLAGWTKRAFLKGRERLVDPNLFERHRRPGG